MQSLAIDFSIEPIIYLLEICFQVGILQEEIRELLLALIAFLRIPHQLWSFF